MGVQYLDLVDFLVVAEAVLGVEADVLVRVADLHLAESALAAPAASFEGHEFYETFSSKAAVLCSRLIRNHPLPDGNKRVGFSCLREFVDRNGYPWHAPKGDNPGGDETVNMMVGVASGETNEAALARWIEERIEGAA